MTAAAHPVLVIEDEVDIRDALIEILEMEGYSAIGASHGRDALEQLKGGCKPCVILLDLMMPVMDGWAFCEEKEKDPSLAAIPVIVVSAVARMDARNERVRAVDHIPKPFDFGKLLATVDRFC